MSRNNNKNNNCNCNCNDKNCSNNKSMKGKKPTKNNVESDKFLRKNEDIPTSRYNEEIASDVLGSYTGVPENEYEQPVQDADDL